MPAMTRHRVLQQANQDASDRRPKESPSFEQASAVTPPQQTAMVSHSVPRMRVAVSGPTRSILVGKESEQVMFEVSKYVLEQVDAFCTTLDPEDPLLLPEDETYPMEIVFKALHGQLRDLPALIAFQELLQLAFICNKYSLQSQVAPYVRLLGWIDHHWDEDHEPSGLNNHLEHWLEWLFVLGTFNLAAPAKPLPQLDELLRVLACRTSWAGTWTIQGTEHSTCGCCKRNVVDITCPTGLSLPGQLQKRRYDVWMQFVEECRQVRKYWRQRADMRIDFLEFGLVEHMYQAHLVNPLDVTTTVEDKLEMLHLRARRLSSVGSQGAHPLLEVISKYAKRTSLAPST